MKLTSMKTTPAEAKEREAEWNNMAPTQPEYPYGLSISLDDAMLKKLGIDGMPAIGTPMMLTAKVEVCSASQYATVGKDTESNLSVQITDMALDTGDAEGKRAERLYGGKKA